MVKLYIPKYEDLWFREKFMSDIDTMSYNNKWGGTIPFPKEHWKDWYDVWVLSDNKKCFYRYLINEDDEYIGEIAYHYDEELKIYLLDVIIYSKYRKKGYGKEGLNLLCECAKENGIEYVYDNIAIDNKAIKLFLDNGFIEEYRNDEIIMLKKKL